MLTSTSSQETAENVKKTLETLEILENKLILVRDTSLEHTYQATLRKLINLTKEYFNDSYEARAVTDTKNPPLPPPRRFAISQDHHATQIKALQTQVSELEKKNSDLQTILYDALSSIKAIEQERNTLITPVKSDTAQAATEEYKLKRMIAEYKNQIALLEHKLNTPEADIIKQFAALKVQHDITISQKQPENAVDPVIWNNILSQLGQVDDLIQSLKEMTEKVNHLENELEDTVKERDLALEKVDELNTDLDKYKVELRELQVEKFRLENKVDEMKNKMGKLERDLQTAQDVTIHQEEHLKAIQKSKSENEDRAISLSNKLSILSKERDFAIDHSKALERQVTELKQQLDETKTHSSEIEFTNLQVQAQMKNMQDEMDNLETTLGFCRENLKKKDTEVRFLLNQLEELKTTVNMIRNVNMK